MRGGVGGLHPAYPCVPRRETERDRERWADKEKLRRETTAGRLSEWMKSLWIFWCTVSSFSIATCTFTEMAAYHATSYSHASPRECEQQRAWKTRGEFVYDVFQDSTGTSLSKGFCAREKHVTRHVIFFLNRSLVREIEKTILWTRDKINMV